MPKRDSFYTPSALAAKMVKVPAFTPAVVCDFAAGSGELLGAAAKRWPKARLVGIDISDAAVAALAKSFANAEIGRCDFLSANSRRRSPILKKWTGRVDLALLNPPFSCRGGERLSVRVGNVNVSCSTAMAFVLHGFEALSQGGEMVALLPAGCLESEKDHEAWRLLRERGRVTAVSHHDHKTFGECFPTTRMVHIMKVTKLSDRPRPNNSRTPRRPSVHLGTVTLYRGTVQMHSIPEGTIPLIHSTDLKSFAVLPNGYKSKAGYSSLQGPFVAISRVGNPNKQKVALWTEGAEVALSDCIIALQCADPDTAVRLHSLIVKSWDRLAALYSGTGAKYITATKFSRFVRRLGFSVIAHSEAKWQLRKAVHGCS